jgi:hypothetical protein
MSYAYFYVTKDKFGQNSGRYTIQANIGKDRIYESEFE